MKRPSGLRLLVVVIFLSLFFPINLLVAEAKDITPDSDSVDSFEDQVINLVNQERAKVGVRKLTVVSELSVAAKDYARFMLETGYFGHRSLDGSSTPATRAAAAGYTDFIGVGEDLARGYPTPLAVFNAWMQSESHRILILWPYVDEIGAGYVVSESGYPYWALEFGQRNFWKSPGADG